MNRQTKPLIRPSIWIVSLCALEIASLSHAQTTTGIAMVPPKSDEPTIIRSRLEIEAKIKALPVIGPAALRKKTVLLYHLQKLGKAIRQRAFDVAGDILKDINDGIAKEMGRKAETCLGSNPWSRPLAIHFWIRR